MLLGLGVKNFDGREPSQKPHISTFGPHRHPLISPYRPNLVVMWSYGPTLPFGPTITYFQDLSLWNFFGPICHLLLICVKACCRDWKAWKKPAHIRALLLNPFAGMHAVINAKLITSFLCDIWMVSNVPSFSCGGLWKEPITPFAAHRVTIPPKSIFSFKDNIWSLFFFV